MNKTCSKCGIAKPLSEFYKENRVKDGRTAKCKSCILTEAKIHCKRYYENNKEKILKRHRETNHEQYIKHKENRLASVKNRYQRKKEEIKEYIKSWQEQNKDKTKEYRRNWKSNNKPVVREGVRKRRAKRKRVNENYTKEDEQYTRELFDHKCANCGSTEGLCIDHHNPLSKGFSLNRKNAVLLCNSCNCSKSNKSPEDFYSEDLLLFIEEKLSSYKIQKL